MPATNLWTATCREAVPAPTVLADTADLAIIGGGFTGASAALAGAKAGARVVLFEAHGIGHGGSGRNVGLVNAGLWLPPDDIIAKMGEDAGGRLVDLLGGAPERVFDLIAGHGIDCEANRTGTLHCAHDPSGLRDLETRFRQQNRLGAPVRLLDDAETTCRTGTHRYLGALFDPRAGTIQPLAYARGLARAAAGLGGEIRENTGVDAVAHKDGVWKLEAGGQILKAGALLIATNAYHRPVRGYAEPGIVPVHYFQFATAPLSAEDRERILPGGEGCWDTALVMSSFRIDTAGHLIVGGVGNAGGAGGAVHAAWAKRKLKELFPDLKPPPIIHGWTGRIAMTGDHVPKILEVGPRAYAPFGYSGRGIGPGTVFGTQIAQALLEEDPGKLPIPPVQAHAEPFSGLRGAYYESGAVLTHAIAARR